MTDTEKQARQSAKQRADQLEHAAITDALRKISVFHDAVQRLWGEAHSIPAGCGCTPFYSDARDGERKLRKCIQEFLARYGKNGKRELKKLNLIYGVESD